MLDIDNLTTAIIAKINGDGSTTTIHNKVFVGLGPAGAAKPYCRILITGDTAQGNYGNSYVDGIPVQFSTFATTLSVANGVSKAITALFTGTTIILAGQTNVSCIRRESGVLYEGTDASNVIYHCFVTFNFYIDS